MIVVRVMLLFLALRLHWHDVSSLIALRYCHVHALILALIIVTDSRCRVKLSSCKMFGWFYYASAREYHTQTRVLGGTAKELLTDGLRTRPPHEVPRALHEPYILTTIALQT